ncbi:hypothetical protein GALL_109070 [mine drainage metagenome]|uniref:Phosphodiesterase n=1 Tax=mine drainage metagenome TaxID=410659 RepID=A0A1J5SSK5_9ZZZZ
MKIISHRGYWKKENEKNKAVSFERSFDLGFGTETDLRDYLGEIVISHDIAEKDCISVNELFSIYKQYNNELVCALNVKADGLQRKLKAALKDFNIENYFVFDMSVPDTIGYIKEGMSFYSRQSEYEPNPVFYKECKGIWLDGFNDIWYDTGLILEHLKNKKQVAIVSPDLHKRAVIPLWEKLKREKIDQIEDVILCTDIPEDALNFFK